MNVVCRQCQTKHTIRQDRLKPGVNKAKCRKCGNRFRILQPLTNPTKTSSPPVQAANHQASFPRDDTNIHLNLQEADNLLLDFAVPDFPIFNPQEGNNKLPEQTKDLDIPTQQINFDIVEEKTLNNDDGVPVQGGQSTPVKQVVMEYELTSQEQRLVFNFECLEQRIQKLGGNTTYPVHVCLEMREEGYDKELLNVQEQEKLYAELHAIFGLPLPSSIQEELRYPISKATVHAYAEEKVFNQKWRHSFSKLKNQLPIHLAQQLPTLPILLRPNNVTRIAQQYTDVKKKSGLFYRFWQWIRWDIFGWFRKKYYFNQLTNITPYIAKKIADSDVKSLDGLEELDSETVTSLSNKDSVSLDALKSLNPLIAAELVKSPNAERNYYKESLGLCGLESLDSATARVLSNVQRSLDLSGLEGLEPSTALELAKFRGKLLFLDGITHLDLNASIALSNFLGRRLYLNGIETFDINIAPLMQNKYNLQLTGIKHLNPAHVKQVVQYPIQKPFSSSSLYAGGSVNLSGVQELDAETALALSKINCTYLTLDGLESMDADTAAAIAQFRGLSLDFRGIQELDADTAAGLALFEGEELLIGRLEHLSLPAAIAIAKFSGSSLSFLGIQHIDLATTMALAQFQGKRLTIHNTSNETRKNLRLLRGEA